MARANPVFPKVTATVMIFAGSIAVASADLAPDPPHQALKILYIVGGIGVVALVVWAILKLGNSKNKS